MGKEEGGEVGVPRPDGFVVVRRRVITEAFDGRVEDDVVDSSDRLGCGDGERALRKTSRIELAEEEGTASVAERLSVARETEGRTDEVGGGAPPKGTVSILGRSRDFELPIPLVAPSLRNNRLGLSSDSLSI